MADMLRFGLVLGLFGLALAGPASANDKADPAACAAMQATLAPREADVAELTEARNAAFARAEATKKVWQDVEVHRSISERYAAVADRDKAAYESAREALAREDMALQSVLQQFDTDRAVFNARCSPGN
jgi:hypothetical protein